MAAATQKIVILADDKTGAAIASAVRNTKKLDNQIKKTGDSMRGMTRQGRAQMGQLGHQMQDVAVQLQMGMNPMMILGQQGSQIAAIFGSGGAVFGAFIAIAAVIGSTFIPTLFEAKREAGEFHDKIIEAAGGVDKLTEAQRRLAQLDLQLRIQEQQQAVDSAQRALDEFAKKMETLSKASQGGGRSARGAALATKRLDGSTTDLNQTLELAKAQLAATKEQMDELTGKTKAQEAAVKSLDLEQKKADRDALARMKAIFAADDLRAKKFKRDAEERMKLIFDSMSAEQRFAMESKRIASVLKGDDGVFSPLEVEAYRVAIEALTEKYFKAGKAIDSIESANEKLKISLNDVKRDGIMSLEDSLVSLSNGTKTVKEAFSDMARSILNDIVRMQIRNAITVPLANAMGVQMRANGGPVSPNKPYIVGEKGPELMIPRGGGTVVPNSQMGGGEAPVTVNVNVTTGVQQTVRTEIANMLPDIANATKAAVIDARRRGGSMAKAFGA